MSGARGNLDWLDDYLAQLTTQRKLSPHTIAAYESDLRELDVFCKQCRWDRIAYQDIRRCAIKLHAGGLAPRSIARKLSSWRVFFAWLGGQITLAANPVEGVRAPKRPKSLPKALSVDDAVRLVAPPAVAADAAAPEAMELCNRAMFELLYSSGLRVSELAGLDLHFIKTDGYTSLGWIDLAGAEVTVTGKGDKMRKVPVGKAALTALAAWIAVRPAAHDGSLALFLSNRGSRVSPRVIQLRIKTHAQKVGIPVDVHPHVLRHSFASHVLQSSGDLRAVQEMLGHSSITSTQIYTALDFQHLAAVYDKAHPRAKIKN